MDDGLSGKLPSDALDESVVIVRLTQRELTEARRLLSKLASGDANATLWSPEAGPQSTANRPTADLKKRARQILNNRRRRFEIFGRAMFAEPAWEMLLILYLLEGESRQTISRLAEITDISKSTALRWIEYLHAQRLVARESHPTDKRAAFVELTAKGRDAIELYLSGTVAVQD